MITRRELTAAIRLRYDAAVRNSKKAILDEFVKVTGYHRKRAIRILTTDSGDQPKRQGGHRVYQEAVQEALIALWEAGSDLRQAVESFLAVAGNGHGAAWTSAVGRRCEEAIARDERSHD